MIGRKIMTEKFVASNGVLVLKEEDGEIRTSALYEPHQRNEAMREYFLHERDRVLGRWRWPENPDYVVYPQGDGQEVRVVNERTGYVNTTGRPKGFHKPVERMSTMWRIAARAYFEAHTEPKPWHDAKPGEVWVANIRTGPTFDEVAFQVREYFTEGIVFKDHIEDTQHPLTDPAIIAARRIWPEDKND